MVRHDPQGRRDHARPHNAIGVALLNAGQTDQAMTEFNKALAIDPYYAGAHGNLGIALLYKNDSAAAVAQFQKALSISPYEFDESIHFLLGSALLDLKHYADAETALNAAITIRPAATTNCPGAAWPPGSSEARSIGAVPTLSAWRSTPT